MEEEKGSASVSISLKEVLGGITVILLFFVIGPLALLLAWPIQLFASRAPIWDPDRYWDGVKGYAVLFGLLYLFFVLRFGLFTPDGHLDLNLMHLATRLGMEAINVSPLALLRHWTLGLLLAPLCAFELERSSAKTRRYLLRILTSEEQQRLAERKQQAKQRAAERMRLVQRGQHATATKGFLSASPLPEAQKTFVSVHEEGTSGQRTVEEQRRSIWLQEQAAHKARQTPLSEPTLPSAALPTAFQTPPSPKPNAKKEKQDKGDGSMDDLL